MSQDCHYPKSRRRAFRAWQLDQAVQQPLDPEGEEKLGKSPPRRHQSHGKLMNYLLYQGQFLDLLDPSVLQNALMRRREGNDSIHHECSTSPLADPGEVFATDSIEQLTTETMDGQIDCVNEMNPVQFSKQDDTTFFSDVFDPNMGLWLTDGYMNPQDFEIIVGGSQDLAQLKPQHYIPTSSSRIPFGFLPNMTSSQGAVKIKQYSIPAPAAIVDETLVIQHLNSPER